MGDWMTDSPSKRTCHVLIPTTCDHYLPYMAKEWISIWQKMWLSGGACPGLVREALNVITSVIITKMQRGAEKTMQRWRQRVEGRSHKPRGADSRQPQRLGETRVGAHREPLQGPWPPGSTLTLDSWPPELWAIYIYTHIHTHIHIHIHTHTYTDTHIYICVCMYL